MNGSGTRLVYQFGEFQVDVTQRLLRARGHSEPIPLTSRAFDTLLYLIEHRGELIDKATLMKAIWPNVIVEENNLSQNISTLRRTLGESATEHRFIVTAPGRGYRFVAEVGVVQSPDAGLNRADAGDGTRGARHLQPYPTVQFCKTSDGVRLAYAITGKGSPLVRAGHWLSHVERDWESPVYKHLLWDLSARYLLVRYDHRGNGLSDWDSDDISLESLLRDLETVVDAARVERFALLGMSAGSPVAIAYAAKHPERLTHLVLYGSFHRPSHSDEELHALATLMKEHWGRSNPAFRQVFTTAALPDSTLEEQEWFNEQQRITASPDNAVRILKAIHYMDVSDVIGQVRVPTLVIHVRGDAAVPVEAGRSVAASIPGARFVLIEGQNHMLLERDPVSARFKQELFAFLQENAD